MIVDDLHGFGFNMQDGFENKFEAPFYKERMFAIIQTDMLIIFDYYHPFYIHEILN